MATLAILLWHLYQVMFDPDVCPMNRSWWSGRMPLESYKDEHALDSETILQAVQKGVKADDPEKERPTDQGEMNSTQTSTENDEKGN